MRLPRSLWTHTDPTLSPATAAQLYAGGRKVLDLTGLWVGGLFPGWTGRFRLPGGRCWLTLSGDSSGTWTIDEGPVYERED